MENRELKRVIAELISMSVQEENGDMWFAASNRNGAYRIDSKTHEIIEKIRFENEDKSEYLLYHNMEVSENRIFFAPHRAEKIAVYEINECKMRYLNVKPVEDRYINVYSSKQKFGSTFQNGKYIYILGYSYPAIVKIDSESLEITYIDDWVEKVYSKIPKGDTRGIFTMGMVKKSEKILLPLGCMPGLLELDLDTDETRLILLDIILDGIGGVSEDENGCIWMTGRGNIVDKVVRWDIQEDTFQEITICLEEKNCIVPFYEPICYKNKIFLFPIYSNNVYEINISKGEINIEIIFESLFNNENIVSELSMRTFSPRIVEDKLMFITGWDRKWHEYSLESKVDKSFYITDTDNMKECIKESLYRNFKNTIVWEKLYKLNDYIGFILSDNYNVNSGGEGKIGEKINSAICRN